MNGRGGKDRDIGTGTCEKDNGGSSLVDYLLVQEDDMNAILDFEVVNRSGVSSE